MDALIELIVGKIIGGGPEAIIAIAVGAIVFLVWERQRLIKIIEKKDEKLEKIVDDYYKGNITLSDALTSLKIVLYEIKAKL